MSDDNKNDNKTIPAKPGLVKRYFKSFVDVKKWITYDEISHNTKFTARLCKRFFAAKDNIVVTNETFEEGLARLNITESDLVRIHTKFFQAALIYTAMICALTIYTIYLIYHGHTVAIIFNLILSSTIASLAYQKYLWCMQIKKRKLGCTFSEWITYLANGCK